MEDVTVAGWGKQLPEQINRSILQRLNEGAWFQMNVQNPECAHASSIAKIKTIRSSSDERIVVLWLDWYQPEQISIQVYSVETASDMMMATRWIDGYAFGHRLDDEDTIFDLDGKLDEKAMFAAIYESLENMEYNLVGRKELQNYWQMYREGKHLTWSLAPWMEHID